MFKDDVQSKKVNYIPFVFSYFDVSFYFNKAGRTIVENITYSIFIMVQNDDVNIYLTGQSLNNRLA